VKNKIILLSLIAIFMLSVTLVPIAGASSYNWQDAVNYAEEMGSFT